MNIYEAIADIMKEGCAVTKSKRNTQQGFQYRGIDDVMNTFQPLMAERGIFLVPEVIEATREERQTKQGGNLIYSVLKIRYTFYASDGSSVSATVIGEGMDSGDKASNKAMAVAMKYAMFQVFCIPTEEMQDPDAESHDVQPKRFLDSPPPEKPLKPFASPDGDFQTVCADCGREIDVRTHDYSVKYYKRPLCRDCQKNASANR